MQGPPKKEELSPCGTAESRARQQPVCRQYQNFGRCNFGEDCKFIHRDRHGNVAEPGPYDYVNRASRPVLRGELPGSFSQPFSFSASRRLDQESESDSDTNERLARGFAAGNRLNERWQTRQDELRQVPGHPLSGISEAEQKVADEAVQLKAVRLPGSTSGSGASVIMIGPEQPSMRSHSPMPETGSGMKPQEQSVVRTSGSGAASSGGQDQQQQQQGGQSGARISETVLHRLLNEIRQLENILDDLRQADPPDTENEEWMMNVRAQMMDNFVTAFPHFDLETRSTADLESHLQSEGLHLKNEQHWQTFLHGLASRLLRRGQGSGVLLDTGAQR